MHSDIASPREPGLMMPSVTGQALSGHTLIIGHGVTNWMNIMPSQNGHYF